MTTLTHAEARRLVQAAADGPMDVLDFALLDAHLAECAECRAYADELKSLESALTRTLRARWDPFHPAADAASRLRARRRVLVQPRPRRLRALALGLGSTVAALVVLSGLFAVWAAFRPAPLTPLAASSGGGGLIAFESDRDGNREIYVMYPDGSGLRNLTQNPADDFAPAWSPDGSRIVFLSTRSRQEMTLLGFGRVGPSGQPAGWQFAIPDIFVMNADGSGVVQLTGEVAAPCDLAPDEGGTAFGCMMRSTEAGQGLWGPPLSWSPDGSAVVAAGGLLGAPGISVLYQFGGMFRINADGSGIVPLTDDRFTDFYPKWSPDGSRIAYLGEGSTQAALYVINSDGSGRVKLGVSAARTDYVWAWLPVESRGPASAPPEAAFSSLGAARINPFAWSPDGARLAYSLRASSIRYEGGVPRRISQIKVVNADGSNERVVLEVAGELSPAPGGIEKGILSGLAWSPDGRRLLLASDHEATWAGDDQLYLMWSDGWGLRRLTDGRGRNNSPQWSPDGEWIAFTSNRSGDDEIYLLNVADALRVDGGLSGTRVTFDSATDAHPVWQPRPAPVETVGPLPSPTPIGGGLIVFESARDGNEEIYVMNARGDGVRNLSDHPGPDAWPAWSPDGTRLAFLSTRSGRQITDGTPGEPNSATFDVPDVFVMNADGTGVLQLTLDPEASWLPPLSWSADGAQLVATRVGLDAPGRPPLAKTYRIHADGSGVMPVTQDEFQDARPQWSPDGRRIAVVNTRYTAPVLLLVNPDGSDAVKLVIGGSHNVDVFDWSPDGSRIAYLALAKQRFGNFTDAIRAIGADGSDEQTLIEWTQPYARSLSGLAWSPDGRQLLFASNHEADPEDLPRFPDEAGQLYVMWADGTGLRRLTAPPGQNVQPGWSPDGEWIVFVSDRDGDQELYVLRLADALGGDPASNGIRLTFSPGEDRHPAWQP